MWQNIFYYGTQGFWVVVFARRGHYGIAAFVTFLMLCATVVDIYRRPLQRRILRYIERPIHVNNHLGCGLRGAPPCPLGERCPSPLKEGM